MSYTFIVLRSTLEQQYSLWAEKRTPRGRAPDAIKKKKKTKNVVIGCNLKHWRSLLNEVGVGPAERAQGPI